MAENLEVDLEILSDQAITDFKRKLSTGLADVKIGSELTKEMQSQLDGAENKALGLQRSLKSLAAVDPKGKGLDWISKQALASSKEISGVNQKLQTIQKLASQTTSKSLLKIYEDDAKGLQRELDQAEKKMRRLEQARFNKAAPISSQISTGSGDFGSSIAQYAAPAAIGAAAIKVSSDIISAGKAGEGSMQQLISATKQAGTSFDEAAKKSDNFARLTGQSEQAAKSSYASILEFSKQAGRTDQVDKLSNGLADLFAAKNIDTKTMPDLLSQLKTGQDEVFDRLAGANPSKFYNEYAVSIGTTAEKLNDAQKAQVRFDTVVKLSTIFDGTAEKRLKSMSGQLDSVAAGFENLYTRAGKAVAPFVKAQLENITNLGDFFSGKGLFASDEDKAKLRAQAQKDSEERARIIVDGLRSTEQKIIEAQSKPYASLDAFKFSKLDQAKFALASIAQEIEEIRADGTKLIRYENQGEVAARLQILVEQAATQATNEAKAYKDSYERTLADKSSSVSLLQLAQKDFETKQNLFPEDVKAKLRKEFAESISSGVAKGFEESLNDQTAGKLVSNLKKLQAGVGGLLPETTKKLIDDFEKALKAMSERAASVRDTIKDALISSSDNPLVKLMDDFQSATTRAEKKVQDLKKVLDPAEFSKLVENLAAVERSAAQARINKELFENSKTALDFDQEARRLKETPASQLDQFARRLESSGAAADFNLRSLQNQRAREDAQFFANQFNPNNPKTALQNRFGNNVSEFSGESKLILDQIKALRSTDLKGTGDLGAGVLAEKIEKIITIPQERLLQALGAGGAEAFNAQQLLNEKAKVASEIERAELQKNKDRIELENFKDLTTRDALEQIKNLNLNGAGLTDKAKIQEFLAITKELGNENLTADLRRARIQALGVAANDARSVEKQSNDLLTSISGTITEINAQLKAKGLTGFENTVRIIDQTGGKTRTTKTPNQLDTDQYFEQ